MARLPEPGKDSGTWGNILNEFLSQAHAADGTLKDGSVSESKLSSAAQTKLNAPGDWGTLIGKPAVVATGANQAAARSTIGAASQRIMRPNGPRLGVLGDSLQSYGYSITSGSHVAARGPVIWRRVEWLTRRRIQMTNPQQDPGDTIDDIIATQLPALLAANPLPNACAIAIGRNDVSSSFNLTTWMGKLETICAQLADAGIVPILETLMPTGAAGSPTAPQTANIIRLNVAITALAARNGYPCVDQYAALVDATGGIAASYSLAPSDTTHLTALGYKAVADALIAQKIADIFPPALPSTTKDTANPFDVIGGVGLFRDASPAGFSVVGTGTGVAYTSPSGGDGIAGRWATVTKVSGSTAVGAFRWTSTVGALTPGHVLRISGVLKMDGIWNVDGSPASFIQLTAEWRSGASTVGTSLLVNRWDDTATITFSEDYTVPAGADGMRIICYLNGTASGDQHVHIAELSVLNLTTMGV